MTPDNLSNKESIAIIESMIQTAKRESTGAGYYFLLWGIIVFVHSVFMYYSIYHNVAADWQGLSWSVFAIGGIFSFVHSKRTEKIEKTKSWYDTLYGFVWSGVGICLAITWLYFSWKNNWQYIIPIVIMQYGFASFITGGTTKFYPSLMGAIIAFGFAFAAFNLNIAYQFLCMAAAVLIVHIIPGYLLYRKYTKAYAKPS
jgi:hypothetical protein